MSFETTIARETIVEGVGLHTGAPCRARLLPSQDGAGYRFRRAGSRGAPIQANAANVVQTKLGTCLSNGAGDEVRTVEHLIAGAALAGVDNLDIEIDGPETPIVDGSALPFYNALIAAGIVQLTARRRAIIVSAPVEIVDGARSIRLTPGAGQQIAVSIAFADAAIGEQGAAVDLGREADRRRLAQARTFCRNADIDAMRAAGFGLGGSLDNAIVVDGAAILNPEGLRDPKEFALHKALDMVGDLALAGAPIIGSIEAVRPGHDLNIAFVRRLLEVAGLPDRASGPAGGVHGRLAPVR